MSIGAIALLGAATLFAIVFFVGWLFGHSCGWSDRAGDVQRREDTIDRFRETRDRLRANLTEARAELEEARAELDALRPPCERCGRRS